jgi:hypothetical protein
LQLHGHAYLAESMTMRMHVAFAKPLTASDRTAVLLAMAALAGARRIVFSRGDRGAIISGEALETGAVRAALGEAGFTVESLASSLVIDELTVGNRDRVERVKPPGR